MSDYKKQLANTAGYPIVALGQEVETKYGKGIVVSASMPHNGLYISPGSASFVVWFGCGNNPHGIVSMTFGLTEIKLI